jgi:hypothetical protein
VRPRTDSSFGAAMRRTKPTWRAGAWWIRDRNTHMWSRWDTQSGRWQPMGWQPPTRDRRQRPRAAPPNAHPSRFGNRARVLLMLTLIVAVLLPGISRLWRVFNRSEPCSETGSIVEQTPLSEVRPDALYTMLPQHPLHWPLTIDEPTNLAFASQGHGSTPGAEEDWRAALTLHGFRDGRLLVWSESPGDDGPMIWAHTNEFASPGDALAFHRWAAQWSCRFMVVVFEISGLPGAVGTRFTWRDGHESEQISFVRGSLREVIATNVDDTYRRDDLIALASAAYEEAESPGICETAVHVVRARTSTVRCGRGTSSGSLRRTWAVPRCPTLITRPPTECCMTRRSHGRSPPGRDRPGSCLSRSFSSARRDVRPRGRSARSGMHATPVGRWSDLALGSSQEVWSWSPPTRGP